MTKCPKCGTGDATVVETRDHDDGVWTRRRRWCVNPVCCIRFTSYEKLAADPAYSVVPRTGAHLVAALAVIRAQQKRAKPMNMDTTNSVNGHHGQGQPDPANGVVTPHSLGQRPPGANAISSVNPPAIASGGVGGGLSSDPALFPVSVLSDPDPDPSSGKVRKSDRARGARRGRKAPPTSYAPEFLDFWHAISSPRAKGMKAEAFERWEQRGRPPAALLIRKWNEYLASLGETFPKDVCRWIGWGGYEEDYDPPPAPQRPPTRLDQRRREHEQGDNAVFEFAGGTK